MHYKFASHTSYTSRHTCNHSLNITHHELQNCSIWVCVNFITISWYHEIVMNFMTLSWHVCDILTCHEISWRFHDIMKSSHPVLQVFGSSCRHHSLVVPAMALKLLTQVIKKTASCKATPHTGSCGVQELQVLKRPAGKSVTGLTSYMWLCLVNTLWYMAWSLCSATH